jgi:hypothetical protein
MSFTKDESVQFLRCKSVKFDAADVIAATTGVFIDMISIPATARVVGGQVTITEAFNSTSSDSFTAGDKGTTNRFKTTFSGQSTGVTALAPTGDIVDITNDQKIGMTWIPGSGTPTTGKGILDIYYLSEGIADEMAL